MHLAAAKGHLRCLELLTEHGGLVLARDKRGETVLQLAERMNQEDVIHYIARHSAQHPNFIKVHESNFELYNTKPDKPLHNLCRQIIINNYWITRIILERFIFDFHYRYH